MGEKKVSFLGQKGKRGRKGRIHAYIKRMTINKDYFKLNPEVEGLFLAFVPIHISQL